MSSSGLNQGIKKFYNSSTDIWLNNWGEHMHHGFYDGTEKNDQDAQILMIEKLLEFSGVKKASNILDLGCGVGGSARYLAKKFNATVQGFTLSDVQVKKGSEFNRAANLDSQVQLYVKDMMEIDIENKADFIWSMESAEHIKDKEKLFNLIHKALITGKSFSMATWCINKPHEQLTPIEEKLMRKIYNLYHLPEMVTIDQLVRYAEKAGFSDIREEDWSSNVSKFWGAVIKSALSFRGLTSLIRSNFDTIKGAWAMRYMQKGYRSGLIRFGVLTGTK